MFSTLVVKVLDSLAAVAAQTWDRLVADNDPFVEHAFLHGLELSGSVGPRRTGWLPRHLAVYAGDELVAAMPLYEKYNSRGEYIFDWGWADAAQRAGIPYYPKLVAAVPFTPVTGRRLLVAPGLAEDEREAVTHALLTGLQKTADQSRASSVHLLFLTDQEQRLARDQGFLPRKSYQFHWQNDAGWQCFADYLGAMRSRVRKQIKRERREANGHGLEISVRRGHELDDRQWCALWELYNLNLNDKWGVPYLTRGFFRYAQHALGHRVVVALASKNRDIISAALLFVRGDTLYGRYWGTRVPLRSMHFELCYYQPIAWCLENGVARFEAGAQGTHKLKRGLLPASCFSAHWLRHPALAAAIEDYLPREAVAVSEEMELLAAHGPFKAV